MAHLTLFDIFQMAFYHAVEGEHLSNVAAEKYNVQGFESEAIAQERVAARFVEEQKAIVEMACEILGCAPDDIASVHWIKKHMNGVRVMSNDVYIISNASLVNFELGCRTIWADTYQKAITLVQDSIAQDFGFTSWEEYLSFQDPAITEEHEEYEVYTIFDSNSEGHQEYYRIEKRVRDKL